MEGSEHQNPASAPAKHFNKLPDDYLAVRRRLYDTLPCDVEGDKSLAGSEILWTGNAKAHNDEMMADIEERKALSMLGGDGVSLMLWHIIKKPWNGEMFIEWSYLGFAATWFLMAARSRSFDNSSVDRNRS